MTLDAGLDEAGIQVPDCLRNDDLRYAFVPDREHFGVYLRLTGQADCVNSFLSLNEYADVQGGTRIADLPDRIAVKTPDWMTANLAREIGWRVDASRKLHVFRGGTPYSVGVVVQQADGVDYHAYTYGIYGL